MHKSPSRQTLFYPVGVAGQRLLSRACVGIVGCGALGSRAAELCVRAGIGRLVLIDRDYVEAPNLSSQTLYSTADISLMKALVCREKLLALYPRLHIVAHAVDLTSENLSLLDSCDLILDGTDNFSTRFLLNAYCRQQKKPFVFASVAGASGLVYPVLDSGPCLSCIFTSPTAPVGTCDTEGVLATAPAAIAALQVTEAMKILLHKNSPASPLLHYDIWHHLLRTTQVRRRKNCAICRRDYSLLSAPPSIVHLCGKGMWQIRRQTSFDLLSLARKLQRLGSVQRTPHCLFFAGKLSIFADGRVFVKSTTPARAQTLYTKYLE